MNDTNPTAADVLDAMERLNGVAVRTPILRSDELDARAGGKVFVKFESLQHTGAFKFRGAYNCLSRLDRRTYPDGVLAYSTGNHGQAIATVGRMLGLATTIVMPVDAPSVKIAKARAQDANVILYDRRKDCREDIAASLAAERRYVLVPPGDNRYVIAGQGTVAAEALQALEDTPMDVIAVPCGGGGLAAGTCLAVEALRSHAQVWAAEPAGFDDTRRSLASGQRERNATAAGSICDALLAPTPAEMPFAINQKRLAKVLVADDSQVATAMRLAYECFRIVIEPGGAVALAALLAEPGILGGRTALVVASGGNVDMHLFAKILSESSAHLAAVA